MGTRTRLLFGLTLYALSADRRLRAANAAMTTINLIDASVPPSAATSALVKTALEQLAACIQDLAPFGCGTPSAPRASLSGLALLVLASLVD